ncbi:flagellar assembly protein FliX [Roseospirillum parvum]|uniref:Class II flagellar assembly regulator n=1 Tax=Roseospirillum parvum TaxID=83401 RepID=A0A1G8FUK5_9PROT|nr:flagellar assembly protein FliX [Roseospirillum parvum]SDH85805.1 Class II flagellar assembly regulator [Roseospirillum parvum]
MKVGGIGSGQGPRRPEKSRRSGDDGAFGKRLSSLLDTPAGGEAPIEEAAEAGPVSGLDALLAVQAAGQAGDPPSREASRRLIDRGEALLDHLETLRHGLLTGAIPKERLADLARLVRQRRGAGGDPRIAALLDEIELRVEVELAKLTRELDRRKHA